jgi:phage terminase large subunit GpA-like protein
VSDLKLVDATQMKNHIVTDRRFYYRSEYLKSDHWKLLKKSKLNQINCCEICGSNLNLDVHHLNYKNLYDVTEEDLQVLCRFHHEEIHLKQKKEMEGEKIRLGELRENRKKRKVLRNLLKKTGLSKTEFKIKFNLDTSRRIDLSKINWNEFIPDVAPM